MELIALLGAFQASCMAVYRILLPEYLPSSFTFRGAEIHSSIVLWLLLLTNRESVSFLPDDWRVALLFRFIIQGKAADFQIGVSTDFD